jgi:hypothetical protein
LALLGVIAASAAPLSEHRRLSAKDAALHSNVRFKADIPSAQLDVRF